MMAFFASFNTPDLAFMPKLEDVFGLYTKMLLGMGVVFQMPTVVFFLAKMKMITARFLLKHFKYAFLIIFIVAAVITLAHSDKLHAVPFSSSTAARSAMVKAPAITAQSEADGRPGRREVQASQASPANPAATATGTR